MKSYTLKKDYLSADGVTVPKGTVFMEKWGNNDGYSYVSDIRKYDDAKVGEIKTRLHLNPSMVENNPEWFQLNEFYYLTDTGDIAQSTDWLLNDHRDKLRAYGNFFRSKAKAEEAQRILKIFFAIQNVKRPVSPISKPNTGTTTKEARAEKAGCHNQYSKVLGKVKEGKKMESDCNEPAKDGGCQEIPKRPGIVSNDDGEVIFLSITAI